MATEVFSNSFLSIFYNPFYVFRKELYKHIAINAKLFKGITLDFGCGTMPYKHLFNATEQYIGLDIEQSGNPYERKPDILYDGKVIPIESNTIDNVFCAEVLEHVFNPNEVLAEINRITKPQGFLLLTCPFTIFEHEVPYDYARYSSYGLTHLLKENGFEVITLTKTGSYLSTILQLIATYIYFAINKIPILGNVLFIIIITPLFLLANLADALPNFIKRKDLYLNNVVLAKKVKS
jgi:SAM-dependent methyltransferase